MEGGMIENTVKQMRRIYSSEGRQKGRIEGRVVGREEGREETMEIIERELNEKGIEPEIIEELRKKLSEEKNK